MAGLKTPAKGDFPWQPQTFKQRRDQLANGGGAFPFGCRVIVAGFFTVLFRDRLWRDPAFFLKPIGHEDAGVVKTAPAFFFS